MISFCPVTSLYSLGILQDHIRGEVNANDISFHYPTRPEATILDQFSISIAPGQTLALVGTSGGGKSTVISLLERFYNISSGTLTIDGNNVQELNLRWLHRQISIVSQEPSLFSGSIAANIRYGALFKEVTDKDVIAVAKAANIHDFIMTLPDVSNYCYTYSSYFALPMLLHC